MSEVFLTREEIEHPYANLAVMLEDKRKKAEQMRRTVFAHITQSPETLAEEFVTEFSIYGGRCYWCSLLLAEKGHSVFEQRFNTKADAIAATVAKLKENCNE